MAAKPRCQRSAELRWLLNSFGASPTRHSAPLVRPLETQRGAEVRHQTLSFLLCRDCRMIGAQRVSADRKYPRHCRFCLQKRSLDYATRHTNTVARGGCIRVEGLRDDERAKPLADTRPSRAVSRNRNIGMPSVSGVWPDRFDHQVEFIGAVNPARSPVRPIGRNELGSVEVVQAINALGVAVPHQERRARAILRPRELDQLAQAR